MDKTALNVTLKKGVPAGQAAAATMPAALYRGSRLFKGDPGNPFLAPRGVCLAGGRLFVADTGQNRVFIWNSVPQAEHAPPDVVLGQLATADTGRNAGLAVHGGSLQYPSGIWSDGERLVVADAWNHRVLIWHTLPSAHGQAADVVIGQPDMTANQPNVRGIGSTPSAHTLNWPYGVTCHEGRLFIADTGNRRVLVYDTLPVENFAKADSVIGKPNFDERDYEPDDAIWPYSVKLSATGSLAITDTQYYRVLLWHRWQDALAQKADVIIGQADFEHNGQNQFGLFPDAHTLNWCYDTCFYRGGLLVADTGNSRALWFSSLPQHHNARADNLIGHANFNIGSENAATILGTEAGLYWPFSLSAADDCLALADTGNHRVALYDMVAL